MKDKPKASALLQPVIIAGVAERLTDTDKNVMDNARLKSDLEFERVKTALSQKENAELSYNNLVLSMALKYRLSEGDIIEADGTIKRNS